MGQRKGKHIRREFRGVPGFGTADRGGATQNRRIRAAAAAWRSEVRAGTRPGWDEASEEEVKYIYHFLKWARRAANRRLRSTYHVDVRYRHFRRPAEEMAAIPSDEMAWAILTFSHWNALFLSMWKVNWGHAEPNSTPSGNVHQEMYAALCRCYAEELPLIHIGVLATEDTEGAVISLAGIMAMRLRTGTSFASLRGALSHGEHATPRDGMLTEIASEAALALDALLGTVREEGFEAGLIAFGECHNQAANSIRRRLGGLDAEELTAWTQPAGSTVEAGDRDLADPALKSFVERQAILKMIAGAEMGPNERQIAEILESDPDAAAAYGGNQRLSELTGRPAGQVGQEKMRMRKAMIRAREAEERSASA